MTVTLICTCPLNRYPHFIWTITIWAPTAVAQKRSAYPLSKYIICAHRSQKYKCHLFYTLTSTSYSRPFFVGVYCYNLYDNCTFYLTILAKAESEETAALSKKKLTKSAIRQRAEDREQEETDGKKLKSSFLRFVEIIFEFISHLV